MRDGKKTMVVRADITAYCDDCGAEAMRENPWRWARKHVEKTGHIAGVTVTYDVHPIDEHTLKA